MVKRTFVLDADRRVIASHVFTEDSEAWANERLSYYEQHMDQFPAFRAPLSVLTTEVQPLPKGEPWVLKTIEVA